MPERRNSSVSAAVKESRERVRAAIKNCGHRFPAERLTVNLAPADQKKEGPALDLPIALGVLSWAKTARLIRGTVLQLKEKEYVQACRIDGGSSLRIIMRHLLPNCIPTLIITVTMGIPSAILSEASLSFLGLGVRSPMASWGAMISSSKTFIRTSPFYSLFPGFCIIITVIAFNMLGDGLRDALDPKLRK